MTMSFFFLFFYKKGAVHCWALAAVCLKGDAPYTRLVMGGGGLSSVHLTFFSGCLQPGDLLGTYFFFFLKATVSCFCLCPSSSIPRRRRKVENLVIIIPLPDGSLLIKLRKTQEDRPLSIRRERASLILINVFPLF